MQTADVTKRLRRNQVKLSARTYRLMKYAQRTIALAGSFPRERTGATTVEFAFVALPMLMAVLAGMSVGMVFYMTESLDYAVEKAARSMLTGTIQSSQISASQYQTTLFCPMLPATFDCTKVIINVLVERRAASAATTTGYNDRANATTTALLTTAYTQPGTASFCTGQPGDYVYIQVLYPLSPLFTFVSPTGSVASLNGNPAYLLDSTMAFRNEQFPSTSTGC